ncbi:hypothetical protein NEOLEDRAFT_1087166 [Neolentinus lepideus HHB14362 ss-1]|uniref:Uncharacterized protein n=1 Tax=Neolentinus lepideus HHB14362 ss-1 TaxID=1314782 RepID=A0A165UI18_9AGAM|nr:hypothetical protein NEOLEDRAFT_1087166 [Neolentinus lepideus HHB14362 ss-1]
MRPSAGVLRRGAPYTEGARLWRLATLSRSVTTCTRQYCNSPSRITLPIASSRANSFCSHSKRLQFSYYYSTDTSQPTSTSFSDPIRPDLFYHLLHPPNPLSRAVPAFALSFLSNRPPTPISSTIIGWLPAQAPGEEAEAGLNDFTENPDFRDLLHEAIKQGLEEDVDDIQRNGAMQLQEGWMHIHDARNVPALGRIGDPDDILATVRVEDGKILPGTYSPMPAYRLCTADGITQLTEGLARKLYSVLEAKARSEKA